MFRLISLNLNGIRSATTKGLIPWLEKIGPNCMGVQEIKAQAADLAGRFEQLADLQGYFSCAVKKGYSGVGLYSRHEPSAVIEGLRHCALGEEFHEEGRWIELQFDTPQRKLSIISCYFPSGSSSPERQEAKFRFLAHMAPHLQALKQEREFILLGDVNIAHHEIDLKNWKGNLKNSGFLPEERAWMTSLLNEVGLVDVYRHLEPTATEQAYTWWSNRGQARAKNVGWRIDYQIATPALAALARSATVYTAERFSDHAPLIVDYDFTL